MPETTVAAIIHPEEGDERILLTKRGRLGTFPGYWCIPGGHIEAEEPFRDAVVREVLEETGLDYEAVFFRPFDEIFPENGIHFVALVFSGVGRGRLRNQESEVVESAWVPLEEARAMTLAFTHNQVLDAYARRDASA
ncbi:MAG TPA: NUDIX hydrolase [Candidatus Dormibacteraeota bacterium]|jgi:8-oxo-dGTP diphosphatase|nr:NUDIX hydrolase [Candidatus Dormibacteraeota bacterium]